MNLRINGEERELPGNLSLQDLVTHLDLTPERIAIELNQNVVRRAAWPSTVLQENDQVEIVHFVGGGKSGGGSDFETAPVPKFSQASVCSRSGVKSSHNQ